MAGEKQDVLESFRSSLADVVAVVEKLAPHCRTFDEMLGMVRLAMENDAQARLLLKELKK